MQKNPYQRVGVFVDVQNMYYSAKNLYGSKVNFVQMLKDAVSGRQLIRAIAYVVRAEEPLEQSFFDALEKAGFELKIKDIQIFPGGVKKADWDVGVAIDMISLSNKLDVMVLASGDGDYVPAVDYLKNQGHRIEAMAFGPSASGKLVAAADEFIDLDKSHEKYLLNARPKKEPYKQVRK